MKKVICDFCNKETTDGKEFILPTNIPKEVRGGKDNALLYVMGYTVENVMKDVCPACREKIAYLLERIDFSKRDERKWECTKGK